MAHLILGGIFQSLTSIHCGGHTNWVTLARLKRGGVFEMNIIGISAFYHDAACCLLKNGKLVAAASEERFTRVKYDPRLPVNAFRYCLEKGGLTVADIDAVAYYENPVPKLARQLWSGLNHSVGDLPQMDPGRPQAAIMERLGYDGPIHFFDHHQSHGASAFFYSGFQESALLVVDGVGEWASTSYGFGQGSELELFHQVEFPHSLGLLYGTITAFLGFRVNDGEYKVMGLAPYGKPVYGEKIRQLAITEPGGDYRLDMKYFDFLTGPRMYSEALCDLLGHPPRKEDGPLESFHFDLACSVQFVLEEILLEKAHWLYSEKQTAHLCMAGGVALNCVANGRILREGPFKKLFVQPAAGDAGGCLGAAALAHIKLNGERHSKEAMGHVFLGPSWKAPEMDRLVKATGLPFQDFSNRESLLLETVVDGLAENKVVGWFHGAMEFGPRALGARSILANPLDPHIRDVLNAAVKKRESFRPFAPSVLASHARDHFDLDHASPFMLEICQVTSEQKLPGITHVNGSARPQTVDPTRSPRYAALIETFYQRTGCPMLVNTSFNVRGEPIVCSPIDALFCFAQAELDLLVLEDYLLDRKDLPPNWSQLLNAWRSPPGNSSRARSAISENLYTFV